MTCPNGVTTHITTSGAATFGARCRGCPVRARCTSATDGKIFKVGEHDELLAANRARWRTDDDLIDRLSPTPAHGRTHHRLARRQQAAAVCRFIGVDANRLGLSLRAAALNLRRLINLGLGHNGATWTLTS